MIKKSRLFVVIAMLAVMAFAAVAVSASATSVDSPPCIERCEVVPVAIEYGSDAEQNSPEVLQALKKKQQAQQAE